MIQEFFMALTSLHDESITVRTADVFPLVAYPSFVFFRKDIIGYLDHFKSSNYKLVCGEEFVDRARHDKNMELFLNLITGSLPPHSLDRQDIGEWAFGCYQLFARDKNETDVNCMRKFITVMRKYPAYGCQLFHGLEVRELSETLSNSVQGDLTVGQQVTIGVCWDGIKVFEDKSSSDVIFLIPWNAPTLKHKTTLERLILEWTKPIDKDKQKKPANVLEQEPDFESFTLHVGTMEGYRVNACIEWFSVLESSRRKFWLR
jgi:hypothetical protein